MNCDCSFYIGTTHDICQDYALSGDRSVTVTDGCSGSILSDFGAKVLSITAMNKISEIKTLHDFNENEVILLTRPAAKILNLPIECLDSTLLCAVKNEETAEAICYGDGVIAIKLTDGNTFVINIEYTDNYPFYINYLYAPSDRYLNWSNNHNNRKVSFSIIKKNGEVDIISDDCVRDCIRDPRLKYGKIEVGMLRILPWSVMVETFLPEAESIIIMSDGVQSFYRTIFTETSKHNEKISYHDILKELLNFKNYVGRFVQRRMNKFLKTCIKNEWHHSDDISIAAIYLGE